MAPFYRYRSEEGVHVVDCSGRVDLETGLARLEVLRRELASQPRRPGPTLLLIDFRHTVWASEEVHRELSAITRRDFGLNADNRELRAAILDTHRSGPVSDNERWFLDEAEALSWLQRDDG